MPLKMERPDWDPLVCNKYVAFSLCMESVFGSIEHFCLQMVGMGTWCCLLVQAFKVGEIWCAAPLVFN